MEQRYIPLSIPNFEGNERKYVEEAVMQGWVSTGGAYIVELEKRLSEYLNVTNVAACQSGTSALHLALIDAGVCAGDAVIVPTLTFIAAVNPVKYQSATPIFMDCDDSLCMDPVKLRRFCEEECVFGNGRLLYKNKHIKALIVVHVFGNMADMSEITEICKQYNVFLIEDATEALGTKYTDGPYAGKYAGTIGDYGCFSFNGNKIITTGGGGAVTCKNPERLSHIKYLSTQAKDDPVFYIHNEVGYNYRMTNVQAAIGVAQMEELKEFITRKNINYEYYSKQFLGYKYASLLGFRENTFSNKWFYSLVLNREYIKKPIAKIVEALKEKGIETRPVWGLIHKQLPYIHEKSYLVEKALIYEDSILNIPSSTQIKEEEMDYVAETVKAELD